MKKTITIIAILILNSIVTNLLFNNLAFGQNTKKRPVVQKQGKEISKVDSTGDTITYNGSLYIKDDSLAFFSSKERLSPNVSKFFIGKSRGYFIAQNYQDTLKILMIICDTTDTGTERFPYQNHNVYWVQGYYVKNRYTFNGEPIYLDIYKRRLPHGIVVMYVKSLD